jgi:hypothetical protein
MKVEDLKTLSLKIKEFAQKADVESHYQGFLGILQHTLVHNQRNQSVAESKDNLFKVLASFDLIQLTYSEKNLFDVLEYGQFLGSSAIQTIEGILHDENFDPAGVFNKMNKHKNEFQQLMERNRSFCSALEKVPSLMDQSLRNGEALLEITFLDKAAVDNIVDFEKWIDSWTKIIRAFSEFAGERPESTRIIFVQKSSPLIIDMATAFGIVYTVGKAVDLVLEKVEKYLKIKKEIEEIKKLKLENKKIEQELEKEAEMFSEKSAQEITAQITAGSKSKRDGSVDNGLSLAIKNLFVFVDKGGRVDCPSPNDEKQKGDMEKLFSEVRKLQQSIDKIRLIPHKTGSDDGAK